MMSKSATIATSIVDKNGKRTTVYRRSPELSAVLETLATLKAAPSPGTRQAPVRHAGSTPLPSVPLLTMDEAVEFIDSEAMFVGDSRDLTREDEILHRPNGLAVFSLAKHLLDNDLLDAAAIRRILIHTPTRDDNEDSYNALLITERLERSPHQLYLGGPQRVLRAVEGLTVHNAGGQPLPRITTVEELRGYTAVVQFVGAQDAGSKLARWENVEESGAHMTAALAVVNPHLDKLLQERPDDVTAILEYTNDRGMHPKNKGPVNALRAWLDETSGARAVSNGWL